MDITLKDHQIRFLDIFSKTENHGLVAVHPTGSGKTILAIYAAEQFLSNNSTASAVFVMPRILTQNLKKEIDKVNPKSVERYKIFSADEFYYGFTKAFLGEQYVEDDSDDETGERKEDLEKAGKVENIASLKFTTENCILIIDEGHNYRTEIHLSDDKKKRRGMKAYSMIKAADMASKVLILTATPLVNSKFDVANLISMTTVNNNGQFFTRKDFTNYIKNREDFKRMIGGKFNFHTLSESDLAEYPKFSYENVFIEMPASLYQIYKDREKYLEHFTDAQLFEEDALSTKMNAFYTGIRQASNLDQGELDGVKSKAGWIKEYVKGHLSEDGVLTRKILIYSQYIKYGINIIKEALDEIKVPYGTVTGSGANKKREEDVRKYNSGELKVLLISKSGREGLDLTYTDDVIINENSWNVATENQVIGRAIRRGSHKGRPDGGHVNIFRLFMVKPSEYELGPDNIMRTYGRYAPNGELKSADLLLMGIALRKTEEIKETFNLIKIFNSELDNEYGILLTELRLSAGSLNDFLFVEDGNGPKSIKREGEYIEKNSIFLERGEMIRNIYIQIPIFHSVKYNYQRMDRDESKFVSFSSEVENNQYIIYANILVDLYGNAIFRESIHSILLGILEKCPNDFNSITKDELYRLENVLYNLVPFSVSSDAYMNLITAVRILGSEDNPTLLNLLNQTRKMGYVSLNNWTGLLEKVDDFQYDAVIRSQIEGRGNLKKLAYISSERGLLEVNLNIDGDLSDLYKLLNMQEGNKVLTFMGENYYPDSPAEDIPTDAVLEIRGG